MTMYIKDVSTYGGAQYKVPQHTYIVSDNKEWVYGYIKADTNKKEIFKKKKPFSTAYRKFKVIKHTDETF